MELIPTPVHAHLASLTATAITSLTTVPLNPVKMEEPAPMELIRSAVLAHLVLLTLTAMPSLTTASLNLARMEELA